MSAPGKETVLAELSYLFAIGALSVALLLAAAYLLWLTREPPIVDS